MPTLEDLYPSGDYGDDPKPPKQTQPTAAKRPTLDELYPLTAGGFDERHLQELEKEFGLTAPTVKAPDNRDLPKGPLDLLLRPIPQITQGARKFADWITDPASDRSMVESYARGALGGAAEGVADLLTPANIAATASGIGPMTQAKKVLNVASALPAVVHGGAGVAEDPTNIGAWGELGAGSLGALLGMRHPTIPESTVPRVTPPEPLRPPTNKFNTGTIGETSNARARTLGADARGVNTPLRDAVELPTLDELYPPTENVQRFGPSGGGAPWRNTNGRTAAPLREPLTLEELLAPPAPEPMRAGGLDVAPPAEPAPEYPRFPRAGEVAQGQQAIEAGESPADALARFFGLEQPRRPIGTGLSDVGQMDLGGRPTLGSELPAELPTSRVPGITETVNPPVPGTRVPTPAEALRPRMPDAATVDAAQAYIAGEGPKPAGFDDLMRFFGEDVPQAPAAAPAAVAPRMMPPPESPAVPEMTLDRLRELLRARTVGGPGAAPELDAMRRLSGDRIPPDLRNELGNILDELDNQPFVAGETIDTTGEVGSQPTGGRWRDSSEVGGVAYESNPDFPNLIRHSAGAPVYHEIGGSQTRGKTADAIRRILEGGRPGDLTDRAVDVAGRRLAARGPGPLTDMSGQPIGEPPIDVLPTGEQQPRLPGDVGAVRDVEAAQPPVADLPEQGFSLTAPEETQASQSGLFGPNATRAPEAGVHPKTQELWDFLNSEKMKQEAALAAEGNPLAEPGGLDYSPAELQQRILSEPNPRNLWAKERALRKILESGGDSGNTLADLMVPLAGSISGGLTGAAADKDNRLRGAVLGALAGGLGGRALARGLGAGGPIMPFARTAAEAVGSEAAVAHVPTNEPFVRPGARPPAATVTTPAPERASISFLDEGTYSNNASGESAASMEALSRQAGMKARGEQFVVYDRTGARRPLIGPDAVDYSVRPGETYGVEGPGGFRKLDDAGGRYPGKQYGDEGFIDTEAFTGGPGEGVKNFGKKAEQAAYFSMLSGPSTILKGHLGPAAVGVSRAIEEGLAGRVGTGAKIIRNMFGADSRAAYMRALREGSADPTASRWGETQGPLGLPSRLMAAPDAWVTESMLDAGIPLESAKRSAFTSEQPRSEVGRFIVNTQRSMPSVIRPIALPFARTATNITERGIERTPLLGMIFEAMQKDPTAWQDVMARQVAGLGAGAAGYAMAGDEGKMPNPYVMAASGPYAVPMAIGAAIRKALESRTPRTGTTDASTRALRDITQAVLSQGPVPTEGYELDRLMDPRMWPTRWIPRVVSSFADPGAYAQPGVLDPLIARIPWLNDYLLNERRQSPAKRRSR